MDRMNEKPTYFRLKADITDAQLDVICLERHEVEGKTFFFVPGNPHTFNKGRIRSVEPIDAVMYSTDQGRLLHFPPSWVEPVETLAPKGWREIEGGRETPIETPTLAKRVSSLPIHQQATIGCFIAAYLSQESLPGSLPTSMEALTRTVTEHVGYYENANRLTEDFDDGLGKNDPENKQDENN